MPIPLASGELMARKSGLTGKLRDEVCSYIAEGVGLKAAGLMAGVPWATVWGWRTRGEQELAGKFRDFYNAVESSKAEGEATLIDELRRAALGIRAGNTSRTDGRTRGRVIVRKKRVVDAKTGTATMAEVEREERTETVLPNETAIRWMLERMNPNRWALKPVPTDMDDEEGAAAAGSSAEDERARTENEERLFVFDPDDRDGEGNNTYDPTKDDGEEAA